MAIDDVASACTASTATVSAVATSDQGVPSVAGATVPSHPSDEKSISPPISNETSAAAHPTHVGVAPSVAGAIGSFFGSYGAFASSGFFSHSGAFTSGLLRSAVGVSLSRKMLSKSHIGNI